MPFAEHHVRQALECGEVVPYFQPIVDIRTGTLHGFEMLARWRHPSHGLVAPHRFIPLIERFGLINDLTTSLLAHGFGATRLLPGDFGLSVNLTPAQLHDRTLPDILHRMADEAEFDLRRLTVEITESALVDDVHLASLVAADLKKLGVRLSLDDFGTGYSSLLHLQALPFDELKLDISFVGSMVKSRQSRKITAAVVGLGLSLGLQTVAEGVEDEEQANLLAWQGCGLGQGYLFGHPVPAEELAHELARMYPGVTTRTAPGATLTDFSLTLDTHPSERLSQLNAIYDGAPVGLAYIDRNLCYVNLNRKMADMNGLSVQEHLRCKVADVVPDLYPQFEPCLKRALAGESLHGVEVGCPASLTGGCAKTLLVSYQPVLDESAEVLGVCVSVSDISVVKEKDAALCESEDHYRHMVELNPQVPWQLDAQGNAIARSSRWEAMTGLTPEQTSGYGWMEALHPDDRAPVLARMQESLGSGAPMDLRYRIASRDGSWLWMRSRGAARRNEAGEIIRWYGSLECIDEHKRALDQLRNSEARLRAIFDAAPVGIILAESGTWKILSVNPRAERILRFRHTPDMTWPPLQWEIADTQGAPIPIAQMPLIQVMGGLQTIVARDVQLKRLDGSSVWISLTASCIRYENGDLLGGVLIIQDIDTTRQDQERLLELAQELTQVMSRTVQSAGQPA